KFKRWLDAPDPSNTHITARYKYHKSTGQWLLEDDRYVNWKQQANSFMWINGISGCGKSIICSTIIEDIKAIVKAQPGTGLAYFYFDINDEAKQTSRSLLSWLVLVLTSSSKNYLAMDRLYQLHNKLTKPRNNELLDLFKELLGSFKQVYIVIDALDECKEYHQLFKVIEAVHDWEMSHFHFLVSSRKEQYILASIAECTPVEIQLSADRIGSDIASYVHAVVGEEKRWKTWYPENIEEKLICGANGMYVDLSLFYETAKLLVRFCWVACQVEQLKCCLNKKMFMKTLGSLPKDLETTYDQILQRIDESAIQYAKILLCWLIFGMRPLKLEELEVIATFDPSEGTYDPSLALADANDVIQVCSSLVFLDGTTVQLAHASVKEYFLARPRLVIELSDIEKGHSLITHGCLQYLLQYGLHKYIKLKEMTLLEYSAEYWHDHYQLSNQSPHMLCIVMKYLDFTAQYGFYGNQLYQASEYGFIRIVKLLLDNGADVNAQGGWYKNALQAALFKGHAEIVRLLLDKGADVNAQSGEYGNALQAASFMGYAKIVRLLLDKGADVNAQGGQYGNALQAASSMGHADIARLLLDKGADVNAQSGEYGNALQVASFMGYAKIARLLLDKGAYVNVQGGQYGNALQAASSMGHAEIARLLLDKGADVNAQSFCWTKEQM
ncbi:hypothetical protein AX14_004715, partial [Amanita brunnescens Koide BX004]